MKPIKLRQNKMSSVGISWVNSRLATASIEKPVRVIIIQIMVSVVTLSWFELAMMGPV